MFQIYLIDDRNDRLSWWRGKLVDFVGVNSQVQWISLKLDRKDDEDPFRAGIISFRMYMRKKEPNSEPFKI